LLSLFAAPSLAAPKEAGLAARVEALEANLAEAELDIQVLRQAVQGIYDTCCYPMVYSCERGAVGPAARQAAR
jgi:hypothetical protein